MSSKRPVPREITKDHVSAAIREIDAAGVPNAFGTPTGYLLVHGDIAYPPKAVIGVAAKFVPEIGRMLLPSEFSSGVARGQAVGHLRELGFQVVTVKDADPDAEDRAPKTETIERVAFTNPERAAQVWHMLISAAHERRILTYKVLSDLTGHFQAGWGPVLTMIMRFCQTRRLPPLTVLVVQSDTGRPGEGLVTSSDHDKDREKVYMFDWYKAVKPPTAEDLAKA